MKQTLIISSESGRKLAHHVVRFELCWVCERTAPGETLAQGPHGPAHLGGAPRTINLAEGMEMQLSFQNQALCVQACGCFYNSLGWPSLLWHLTGWASRVLEDSARA